MCRTAGSYAPENYPCSRLRFDIQGEYVYLIVHREQGLNRMKSGDELGLDLHGCRGEEMQMALVTIRN